MARWTLWAASAIGAAGAGAGLALARRRRSPLPATPPSSAAPPATSPASEAGPAIPEDDPQAALDAARERLRERADRLRADIEAAGDPPPGGG